MLTATSSASLGATTNFGSTLKIFRLTRIVRVAKLSSYSRSLRILATTVYHSTPMLIQLAIIQLSLALCFAVVTFFFERESHREKQFRNMVDSLWYALITMYSIGYGDQVYFSPKSLFVYHIQYMIRLWKLQKLKLFDRIQKNLKLVFQGTCDISWAMCWSSLCSVGLTRHGLFVAYYSVWCVFLLTVLSFINLTPKIQSSTICTISTVTSVGCGQKN